jgi:hypothetical protein
MRGASLPPRTLPFQQSLGNQQRAIAPERVVLCLGGEGLRGALRAALPGRAVEPERAEPRRAKGLWDAEMGDNSWHVIGRSHSIRYKSSRPKYHALERSDRRLSLMAHAPQQAPHLTQFRSSKLVLDETSTCLYYFQIKVT